MPGRRQRLGQLMLVDRKVVEKIIGAADISKNETVLEAGTGQGILTSELCKHARKVTSYEVDSRLFDKVTQELIFDNLELVRADLFDKQSPRFDVFVSNLPYSRSRDAIEWLAAQKFDRAVIMIQREFAEKLQAAPGKKDYRAISVLAAYRFRMEPICRVGKGSFFPQPSVESVLMKIIPQGNPVPMATIKRLNWLFSKRNKRASSVATKLGLQLELGDKRICQLSPSALVGLAEKIGYEQNIHSF